MKKGQLPKVQPLRVLKPKQKQPNNVRAKQRIEEYVQRYHAALYNNGESNQ